MLLVHAIEMSLPVNILKKHIGVIIPSWQKFKYSVTAETMQLYS
jgi:hypothetical protein